MTALDCRNVLLVHSNFPKNRAIFTNIPSAGSSSAASVSLQTGRKAQSKGFPMGTQNGHMSHCIKLWVIFMSRTQPDIGNSPFLNTQKMSCTMQNSWKTCIWLTSCYLLTLRSDKLLCCFNSIPCTGKSIKTKAHFYRAYWETKIQYIHK